MLINQVIYPEIAEILYLYENLYNQLLSISVCMFGKPSNPSWWNCHSGKNEDKKLKVVTNLYGLKIQNSNVSVSYPHIRP